MVRSGAGACHSCANMYHCKWVLLLCECVPLVCVCVCVWHNLCYNLTRIRGTRPTVTPLGAPSSSPTSSPSSKCTSSSPLSTSGARRRTVNLPNRDERPAPPRPREKWLPRPTPAENFQGYPGPPRKCPEFVYHPAPRISLPSPNKKRLPCASLLPRHTSIRITTQHTLSPIFHLLHSSLWYRDFFPNVIITI